MRRSLLHSIALLALVAAGCGGDDTPAFERPADKPEGPALPREAGASHRFDVRVLAEGLGAATVITARPGDPGHVHVAEQAGTVRRVSLRTGRVDPRPVIDVRARTKAGGELGLLGLVYARDGRRAFVHFTTPQMDTRVLELDLRTRRERTLLAVDQPKDYENHKGGQLALGPDGALHLALGDGGSAFNPGNTAQDLGTRFGKLLRFDGRRWRTLAFGLRNPWRFSFDRETGRLWIGDVGQDRIEEVNAVDLRPGERPLNFGWAAYEGPLPVGQKPLADADDGPLTWPVAGFDHDTGCSVTGGVVYRGERLPRLRGRYVFADFCRGLVWSMSAEDPRARPDLRRERAKLPQVTAFGEDLDGEVHAVTAAGRVYSLVPRR